MSRNRIASHLFLKRKTRSAALQALYAWSLGLDSPWQENLCYMEELNLLHDIDRIYLHAICHKVEKNCHLYQKQLSSFLTRSWKQLDPIERLVLCIACSEAEQESPPAQKILLNESIELAKTFGAAASYKFINGVLDRWLSSPSKENPSYPQAIQ